MESNDLQIVTLLSQPVHTVGQGTPFVWSLMGPDAGQPLDEIIIRKEAERRTGGEFWWGTGTPLGDRVESVAILNGGTLPALFSPLENQKLAPDQNTYVWNGWHSIRKGRHGSIPQARSRPRRKP
jgi:hypothetical protein